MNLTRLVKTTTLKRGGESQQTKYNSTVASIVATYVFHFPFEHPQTAEFIQGHKFCGTATQKEVK